MKISSFIKIDVDEHKQRFDIYYYMYNING